MNELSTRESGTHSFCRLEADNLIVSSVKKAEKDGSIVLRVHEINGAPARTPVEFLGSRRNFQPVNLLEEKSGQGEQQNLVVKPYEIGTIQIKLQ